MSATSAVRGAGRRAADEAAGNVRAALERLAATLSPDEGRPLNALGRRLVRPPRIGIVGEFSAGKSTLINLLLGSYVLPTAVIPTTSVPTLLRFGATPHARLVSYSGRSKPVKLPDLARLQRRDPVLRELRRIDVVLPAPVLRDVELLDTPGLADPELDLDVVYRALGQVDACIWCTLATQAWRHTEQQAWTRIDRSIRRRSLLLVTHADALNSDAERKKVLARVKSAASAEFGAVFLLSLTEALAARSTRGGDDPRTKKAKAPAAAALDGYMDAFRGVATTAAQVRWRRQLALARSLLDKVPLDSGGPSLSRRWQATAAELYQVNTDGPSWPAAVATLVSAFAGAYLTGALAAAFAVEPRHVLAAARPGEAPRDTIAAVVDQLTEELAEAEAHAADGGDARTLGDAARVEAMDHTRRALRALEQCVAATATGEAA